MKNKGVLFIVLAAVFLIVFSTVYLISSNKIKTSVHIGDAIVMAEIVDNETSRAKGLAGRTHLSTNGGMLFVFDEEKDWGIWMKDMKIPIDIIWINAGKEIVDIKADVQPSTYPSVFVPKAKAKYVLELPAGTAKNKHILIGKNVTFDLAN